VTECEIADRLVLASEDAVLITVRCQEFGLDAESSQHLDCRFYDLKLSRDELMRLLAAFDGPKVGAGGTAKEEHF
jgi:hypothetical protein